MLDRDTQSRLREVTAHGDPGARLQAGRSLVRAGRRDEALATLWPARQHPDVLRELVGFPAWTHPEGDAGACNAIDCRLPTALPRVRWSVALPDTLEGPECATLVGPVGVAVARDGGTLVLDPDDGHVISQVGGAALEWEGERLLLHERDVLRWVEVGVGEGPSTVGELPCDDVGAVVTSGGLLAFVERDGRALRVVSRAAGAAGVRWSWSPPDQVSIEWVLLVPGAALVTTLRRRVGGPPPELHALDAESGASRFRLPAGLSRADPGGVVFGQDRDLVAIDLHGRERWRTTRPEQELVGEADRAEAINGDVVVTRGGGMYDRRSGELRASLGLIQASWLLGRDVAVAWSDVDAREGSAAEALRAPFVAAFGPDGRALWALDRGALGEAVNEVVACAGRLYVRTPTRVLCLG